MTTVATSSKFSDYFLPSVASIFALVIAQDYVHALLRDYNFYLSESLLFGGFWWLFLPLFWVRKVWLKPLVGNLPFFFRSVPMVLVLSVLHLVLYAVTLFLVSSLLLDATYAFGWSLRYAVSDTLYFALGAYALLESADWRRQAVVESKPGPPALATKTYSSKIAVRTKRGTLYLATGEISVLQSASPYVALRANGKKYLETTTLKALSEVLDPRLFVRIHKSSIVNIAFVTELKSRGNGDYDLVLRNDEEVRLSRNYVPEFKERMQAHQLSQR